MGTIQDIINLIFQMQSRLQQLEQENAGLRQALVESERARGPRPVPDPA